MSDKSVADIAGGLAGRLWSLVAVIDRYDRLEAGSGEWLPAFAETELPQTATAITLRALAAVADPHNYKILSLLAEADSQPVKYLIESSGMGRLMVSERLNDLVQVGLASRMVDTDHAQITISGAALARLLSEIAAEVAVQYQAKTQQKRVR